MAVTSTGNTLPTLGESIPAAPIPPQTLDDAEACMAGWAMAA